MLYMTQIADSILIIGQCTHNLAKLLKSFVNLPNKIIKFVWVIDILRYTNGRSLVDVISHWHRMAMC